MWYCNRSGLVTGTLDPVHSDDRQMFGAKPSPILCVSFFFRRLVSSVERHALHRALSQTSGRMNPYWCNFASVANCARRNAENALPASRAVGTRETTRSRASVWLCNCWTDACTPSRRQHRQRHHPVYVLRSMVVAAR